MVNQFLEFLSGQVCESMGRVVENLGHPLLRLCAGGSADGPVRIGRDDMNIMGTRLCVCLFCRSFRGGGCGVDTRETEALGETEGLCRMYCAEVDLNVLACLARAHEAVTSGARADDCVAGRDT